MVGESRRTMVLAVSFSMLDPWGSGDGTGLGGGIRGGGVGGGSDCQFIYLW